MSTGTPLLYSSYFAEIGVHIGFSFFIWTIFYLLLMSEVVLACIMKITILVLQSQSLIVAGSSIACSSASLVLLIILYEMGKI